MDKYINDEGKIGVIVAHGDAGWSTWAGDVGSEFACMDRGLVELKLAGGSAKQA